jgi:hypothetical protein
MLRSIRFFTAPVTARFLFTRHTGPFGRSAWKRRNHRLRRSIAFFVAIGVFVVATTICVLVSVAANVRKDGTDDIVRAMHKPDT